MVRNTVLDCVYVTINCTNTPYFLPGIKHFLLISHPFALVTYYKRTIYSLSYQFLLYSKTILFDLTYINTIQNKMVNPY
jgi:hypothetical protein